MTPEDVIRCVRTLGVERFLFASDTPWFSQADTLALIRSLPFTAEEREAILGGNARRLLGLDI